MTKVRIDSRGLYIRTNGSIYRPQMSRWSYPLAVHIKNGPNPATSCFSVGEDVTAKSISGSPHARVQSASGEEYWHSHGDYLGPNGYPSKDIPSDGVWAI